MSVDEPSGPTALPGEGVSCGSSPSPSSGDTAGGSGGRPGPEGDTQDLGPRGSASGPWAVVRVTLVSMRGWSTEALHQVPGAAPRAHARPLTRREDLRPAPGPPARLSLDLTGDPRLEEVAV